MATSGPVQPVQTPPVQPNKQNMFIANTVGLADPRRSRRQHIIIAVAAAVLLIAATGIVYGLSNRTTSGAPSVYTADIPADYSLMTTDQLHRRFAADTGHMLDSVQLKDISGSTFKSFKAAYSAARCYFYLGQFDKAVKSYAVADDKSDGSKGYQFYIDYAAAAQGANDSNLVTTEINRAKQAVQSDAKLSADAKTSLIDDLNSKMSYEGSR